MHHLLITSILLLLAMHAVAQKQHFLSPADPDNVMSKNYYFSFMLEKNADIRSMLSDDLYLSNIVQEQRSHLSKTEYGAADAKILMLTDQQVNTIADHLSKIYDSNPRFRAFVDDSICATGCYIQIKGKGCEKVKNIWLQDANAINHTIDVYGMGKKPNYPQTDSVSFDVHSARFTQEILPLIINNILMSRAKDQIFSSISMHAAKSLLEASNRMQATDFEPLALGENKSAYCSVSNTQWIKYPYSAIVVLGVGPETRDEHVTPESLMRAEYAAQCWKNKMVPFIIVSGGRVHPYHTPYCEAWEMKHFLQTVCNIPDSVIIIEPHARHTTTNLRNAGRIMVRNSFPLDKPALVIGSKSHIDYVMSQKFSNRFVKELGFLPVNIIRRKSDLLAEFTVNTSCLQLDEDEPMDP